MRKNRFAEKFGLTCAVLAPNFKHDVRAASGAVFFDALDALTGGTGDGTDFAEDFVGHRSGRGFAAALFHRFGNGLKFLKTEASAFEEHVRGTLDVLYFVGEIHGSLLARSFFALCRITVNAADNDGTERKIGDVLPCFVSTLLKICERVTNESRRGDTGSE